MCVVKGVRRCSEILGAADESGCKLLLLTIPNNNFKYEVLLCYKKGFVVVFELKSRALQSGIKE